MTANREAMTLGQIRDKLRALAFDPPKNVYKEMFVLADAINDLSRAAESVYQVRYVIMGSEKEWFEVCRGDFEKLAAFRCDDIVTQERRILYTHPPEPARDGYFIGGPNASAIVYDLKHAEHVIAALCECTGDSGDDYTVTDLTAAMAQESGE